MPADSLSGVLLVLRICTSRPQAVLLYSETSEIVLQWHSVQLWLTLVLLEIEHLLFADLLA